MQDFLTWGAVIAALGSIITLVKFWMDMGAAKAKAESAAEAAAVLNAKADLINAHLSEFKVICAQTYATSKSLAETEAALARSLESSVLGIYQRLDAMTQRLDTLLTIATKN